MNVAPEGLQLDLCALVVDDRYGGRTKRQGRGLNLNGHQHLIVGATQKEKGDRAQQSPREQRFPQIRSSNALTGII